MSEITQILTGLAQGENKRAGEFLPLVYDELRRLASWHLRNEPPNQTLQDTALVHEAYLRLVGSEIRWGDSRQNGAWMNEGGNVREERAQPR